MQKDLFIKDLEDVDGELCRNLLWTLENDVSDLGLTFIYERENILGGKTIIELIPNGKEIYVT